ncbi:hypothetical protein BGX28_001482 [Mortierella sp. GBA30]|nr:hypothetical protein BGX28_001482 [Mortierella sp. GBA30]
MQETADPCIDFSQYACGGFYEREVIPGVSTFSKLQEATESILRSIVNPLDPKSPAPRQGDLASARNLKKLQSYYTSCMNYEEMIKLGSKSMGAEIRNILELYPAIHGNQRDISPLLAYNVKHGFGGMFTINVMPNLKNLSQNVLALKRDGLGLQASAYTDEPSLQLYEKKIGMMFYLIRGNYTTPEAAFKEPFPEVWALAAKEVTDFETKLAQIKDEPDGPEDDNMYPTSELDKLAPSIDWTLIFNTALPKDVPIPATMKIVVPDYLRKVDTLLQQTKPQILRNYFIWRMIHLVSDQLEVAYKAMSLLDGHGEEEMVKKRSSSCITAMISVIDDEKTAFPSHLGPMVIHFLMETMVSKETIAKTNHLIESIRQKYAKGFKKEYKWLDHATSRLALEKLRKIVSNVAGSNTDPNVFDSASLEKFYLHLDVDDKDYIMNVIRGRKWMAERAFQDFSKPMDRRSRSMTFVPPEAVNAIYIPQLTTINIPVPSMQSPLIHVENTEYVSYGMLGTIIGHELGHAFDTQGRRFDANGILRDWWTNSSLTGFESRAYCFVEQYSTFTVKGPDGKYHSVNGIKTLGENIADNAGLGKAFQAWLGSYKSDRRSRIYNNLRLPGFEKFTPEQMFFVAYAQNWCSKLTPEESMEKLELDTHSPDNVRIMPLFRIRWILLRPSSANAAPL